jgi:anti-sigma B factor antagonist
MSTLARITDEWHDGVGVTRLDGEIDASNVHDVGDRLRSMVTNQSFSLVVDLSGIAYVDSAGINLLFALAEELRGRQQRLAVVVADGSPIARMIALTGLDRVVSMHATLPAALASARG